jgi:maltooligosyltrehalose trehalohydrolase
MDTSQHQRKLPIGAEVRPGAGTHFRVWAPRRRKVAVVLEQSPAAPREQMVFALTSERDGYFSGMVPEARAGSLYRFQVDDDSKLYPDPASRFQPQGPHGPSQVIDPTKYRWQDGVWPGIRATGQVLYEMHIGTFTRAGTWEAASRELPELANAGITVVEIMPVADFPGRFGWGYDGVNLFAPTRLYGEPDDMRQFVDRAHAAGLGVILDVVYNHLGPDGNYLKIFAEEYFTDRYKNAWGEAINFDGPDAGPVRELFTANAACWVSEFHIDGFRFDATQQIFDASPEHILAAVNLAARQAAGKRSLYLVAESESQEVKLVRPLDKGGCGLDGVWNDDFHHSAMVALTGHSEGYYTDFLGHPQELISAIKWGYLYQGQWYTWQHTRRGTPALDVPPAAFVIYIQNHDQIANSGRGLRGQQLTSPGKYRALTALLLLSPGTPLLFQGQEFAASAPYLFFADHQAELSPLVRKGRAEFLKQFRSLASPEMQACLADPGSLETFERCKLDFAERARHAEAYALHRDLLKLRRDDPVFRSQRPRGVDGAVLGPAAFVLRFFGEKGDDRLLLINLGPDLRLEPAPEPLLAPPLDKVWAVSWSSEEPRYGGCGMAPPGAQGSWLIPAETALVLVPRAIEKETPSGAVGEPGA